MPPPIFPSVSNSSHTLSVFDTRCMGLVTSWVSCSVTQFWHHLHLEVTSDLRLRAQSHKDCPSSTSDAKPKSRLLTCASDRKAVSQRLTQPSPWVWLIFARGAQKSSGKQLTIYWFTAKRYDKGIFQMEEMHKRRYVRRGITLPAPQCVVS